MWKVPKWMYIVTVLPFLAIGIGLILSGWQASSEVISEIGLPENEYLYLTGALFIILPFITALGVNLYYRRINVRESNLIQNGIQGEALILSREQTGVYLNELPQIKFILEITSPVEEKYQIEHKDVVNMLDLAVIRKGSKLPVYIDPNDKKNVLLVYE